MTALLAFVRKYSNSIHLIGLKDPENINVLKADDFISGQPVCIVVHNNIITSAYLIKNDGGLFQIYGKNDDLFTISELIDLTLINIEKYNIIKNILLHYFSKYSTNDLIDSKLLFLNLENQVFSNLLHAEIKSFRIKNQIIKLSKRILGKDLSLKFEYQNDIPKRLSKKLLRKKIDVDLSNYNIKIKTNII